MRRVAYLLALAVALSAPAALRAQNSADLLLRGVRAAQNLDYDSAAIYLRSALARTGADQLPDTARARGLMFLGATEFFRERRDSAVAAFGRLIALDPRYRPDQLVFPPEVSSVFLEVRAGTRAVAAVLPPMIEIASAGDRLPVRLYATSLHEITVSLHRAMPNAPAARTLYAGAIGDSLELLWDGRDGTGAVADSGAWVLRVLSRASSPRGNRVIEVPLDLRVTRRDTLPLPPPVPDSLFLPERGGAGSGPRALGSGVLASVAVLVLPSLISSDGKPSGGRYAVAAATSIAGIVGFVRGRSSHSIPENVAANQAVRLAWQRRFDTVQNENASRRRDARLVIRAGAARVVLP